MARGFRRDRRAVPQALKTQHSVAGRYLSARQARSIPGKRGITLQTTTEPTLEALIASGLRNCECGRPHETGLWFLRIGRDATRFLPEALRAVGIRRPFVVCDRRTEAAAMGEVRAALDGAGMPYAE